MTYRKLLYTAAIVTAIFGLRCFGMDPQLLDSNKLYSIYCAYGYTTYIDFGKTPIDTISPGAKGIISVSKDPVNNAIRIFPLVITGHTNLIIVIDGTSYSFEVHIRKKGTINYQLSFTTDPEGVRKMGPPVAPFDIKEMQYINAIRDWGDATYPSPRKPNPLHAHVELQPLDRVYSWNDNLFYLNGAWGFPKNNLVVLTITRRNHSVKSTYLNAKQLTVFISNTDFPPTLASQGREVLYPNEIDIIYIFLQGYNLVAQNDFELMFPPDAKALNNWLATTEE